MTHTNFSSLPQTDLNEVERITKRWIEEFVIKHKLCPFAGKPVRQDAVYYETSYGQDTEQHLHQLSNAIHRLDTEENVQTSFLVYPDSYLAFDEYLVFLDISQHLLDSMNYHGIYQIASFHPEYQFQGVAFDDAANFTNRSPYPMLHLLREQDVSNAVAQHPDIESVPEKNMSLMRHIGNTELCSVLKKIKSES